MRSLSRRSLIVSALIVLFFGAFAGTAAADGPAWVWLESEKPAEMNIARPPVQMKNDWVSGEGWLQAIVEADKVESQVPADGILIGYKFSLANAGKYEIWNRVGFESIRTQFAWRIDKGPWATIEHDAPTIDLMELGEWCEISWLKMGQPSLGAGEHTLEIKVPRTKDPSGKPGRMVYASDALCIYGGEFHPYSKFKPDQNPLDAKDLTAAKQTFQLADPIAPGARSTVSLKGTWQISRHDELLPGPIEQPIATLPEHPVWTAIEVPADKEVARRDLMFAHRVVYRTRVEVPPSCAGQAFRLSFPMNNLNTTVWVNGVYCGFNKNPFAHFDVDVTKAVHSGSNEIYVGIRDPWYAFSVDPKHPEEIRKKFFLPHMAFSFGFNDLNYPVWNAFGSGIVATPTFSAVGRVNATDVFCKPSVAHKELALEVSLGNTLPEATAGDVVCEAVRADTGKVELTMPPQPFKLAADAEQTLKFAAPWADPKLWWPDDPKLYRLRTTVRVAGKPLDVSEVTFGFREWTMSGADFKLNGMVWHGWADLTTGDTPAEWLSTYRRTHQQFMRLMGPSQGGLAWKGLSPDDALDYFDSHGVVVRRCGPMDGEAMGYNLAEPDPNKPGAVRAKQVLAQNWIDQMVAQVKGERNHPSVMIWSLENEILYINVINSGQCDNWEPWSTKCSEAVTAIDSTRPNMTDGGGATKANTLPVQGDHYVMGPLTSYPTLAYEANVRGGGRDRWVWDQKRPRFIGEEFFANGINPFDYATIGGEECFVGRAQCRRAIGVFYRMLMEGYRWNGYGAWHLWLGTDDAEDVYRTTLPVAVFCRQWDWTFGSGQTVDRTLRIFNDGRSDEPITLNWQLTVGGRQVDGDSQDYQVAPGTNTELNLPLKMPTVNERAEGELVLSLVLQGEEVFHDKKAVSVLPPNAVATKTAALSKLPAADLLVYDPAGSVIKFLALNKISFTALDTIKTLPDSGRVLLIGTNAITKGECDSTKFQAYAAPGRSVVVLEQNTPLEFQALPADLEPTDQDGCIGFADDLEHPVLRGLKQKDFFTWGPDDRLYRHAYGKPSRGGRSLVQCGQRLADTALAEMPVGQGLMLVSQLLVGEKLSQNAVAQRVLLNLLDRAASYRLEYRPVAVCRRDLDPNLAHELGEIHLRYTTADDPLAAMAMSDVRTLIVAASPGNLKQLAGNLDRVGKFTHSGGTLFFHNLTPAGLADYNRIVGFEHMIRPFRRERVTFPPVRNPLTVGLTTSDVVLRSGEKIFPWTDDEYVSSEMFTYLVDYDDVAPFAQLPSDYQYNMVSGFVTADAWKLIYSFNGGDKDPNVTFRLPKSQQIVELDWTGNAIYNPVSQLKLTFDGKASDAVVLETQPNNEPQVFRIDPPRTAQEINVRLAKWVDKKGAPVEGIDNIKIRALRSPEFYQRVRPLLNSGGLMQYVGTLGGPSPAAESATGAEAGGAVLCNLLFKDREVVPENQIKKRNILATLLRNLHAPLAEGKTIIAGAKLRYRPIDLSKQANQFRTEKGWFGDKAFTFSQLPTGSQRLAGVPFLIYEFPTSPVPTVLMLDGPGVPNHLAKEIRGIPVGRKADALFFLHTMRLDSPLNPDERKNHKKFETLRYVVTYADGKTTDIPIDAEMDIHDFRQRDPQVIPGAQLAWTAPYPGTEFQAVAYAKQWNNPRPDVEIKSVDMVYGSQPRGVPVLIALTAASAE